MVNDSPANLSVFSVEGEEVKNPATGKPAAWVDRKHKERL
jgi:flagellar biosynthesis component FlhA